MSPAANLLEQLGQETQVTVAPWEGPIAEGWALRLPAPLGLVCSGSGALVSRAASGVNGAGCECGEPAAGLDATGPPPRLAACWLRSRSQPAANPNATPMLNHRSS